MDGLPRANLKIHFEMSRVVEMAGVEPSPRFAGLFETHRFQYLPAVRQASANRENTFPDPFSGSTLK